MKRENQITLLQQNRIIEILKMSLSLILIDNLSMWAFYLLSARAKIEYGDMKLSFNVLFLLEKTKLYYCLSNPFGLNLKVVVNGTSTGRICQRVKF